MPDEEGSRQNLHELFTNAGCLDDRDVPRCEQLRLVGRVPERPKQEEFPATGLGSESPAPRSLFAAQFRPLMAALRLLRFANRDNNVERARL
jgi:hypothetical protein